MFPIEDEQLRIVLDSLNMERNVHVGGTFDAEKLALTEEEHVRMRKQVHYGTTLVSRCLQSPFLSTRLFSSQKI